ncbi:hypothetical protein Ddc_19130 [Ditylenchus destructor]|nr:hypothetical protein Ddc_19130 [Ditylenchus destructor]
MHVRRHVGRLHQGGQGQQHDEGIDQYQQHRHQQRRPEPAPQVGIAEHFRQNFAEDGDGLDQVCQSLPGDLIAWAFVGAAPPFASPVRGLTGRPSVSMSRPPHPEARDYRCALQVVIRNPMDAPSAVPPSRDCAYVLVRWSTAPVEATNHPDGVRRRAEEVVEETTHEPARSELPPRRGHRCAA